MHTSVESPTEKRIVYPESPRVEQVDDYHGVKVADPYRWLEDPTPHADARAGSRRRTRSPSAYLARIPEREPIRKRLTELWNYERYGVPFQRGRALLLHPQRRPAEPGASSTAVDIARTASPASLLDPNTLSQGRHRRPRRHRASARTASSLAYGLASGGSDWQEWQVRDVDTGKRPAGRSCKWVKFSGAAWTHDGKGFFYSRYDEPQRGRRRCRRPNFYQKLYYHRLGTPQSEDVLVYERPDQKEWGFGGRGHRGRPLPGHPRLAGDGRPRTASSTRTSRERRRARSSSCSTTSTPSTASSATTARSSASRPTSTPRAAG